MALDNWGGVLFASRLGKQLDANPKKWRLVAALALDTAAALELLAPTASTTTTVMVLPLACAANVLKNIGFLTASASRAALHQSLAVSGNLADVTAKSASQSMAAGLVGTAVGIGLSSVVLGDELVYFFVAFGGLAAVHQGFNYWALTAVSLRHFNKHRLYLVLRAYCESDGRTILAPETVAREEVTFPLRWHAVDDTDEWLSIGKDLPTVCPGGAQELALVLHKMDDSRYILNIPLYNGHEGDRTRVYLTFLKDAQGKDVIEGVLAAVELRRSLALRKSTVDPQFLIRSAYQSAKNRIPRLLTGLRELDWSTATDETNIEPRGAVRLEIASPCGSQDT